MPSFDKIYTCVDAEEAVLGTWGYFSNDLGHMKQALKSSRINSHAYYDKLDKVLEEKEPRRFSAPDSGQVFALFCPVDTEYNENKY